MTRKPGKAGGSPSNSRAGPCDTPTIERHAQYFSKCFGADHSRVRSKPAEVETPDAIHRLSRTTSRGFDKAPKIKNFQTTDPRNITCVYLSLCIKAIPGYSYLPSPTTIRDGLALMFADELIFWPRVTRDATRGTLDRSTVECPRLAVARAALRTAPPWNDPRPITLALNPSDRCTSLRSLLFSLGAPRHTRAALRPGVTRDDLATVTRLVTLALLSDLVHHGQTGAHASLTLGLFSPTIPPWNDPRLVTLALNPPNCCASLRSLLFSPSARLT